MQPIRLILYVAGQTPRSERAIANLRRIAAESLAADTALEVVDVVDHPEAAEAARILTTPTVVKASPAPQRRVTGDLSDASKVLSALSLEAGHGNQQVRENAS